MADRLLSDDTLQRSDGDFSDGRTRRSGGNIYDDIAQRTGGDIYIGVVGPVRTGKSTFIKRFMNELVMDSIVNDYDKQRARDEMPQSAAGKTVMTTEPKFIPDEAVEVALGNNTHLKVKMIDCVGYIVPGAIGTEEDGEPRMVQTPWSDEPVPFADAAEIGTEKVIRDHSTIAVAVTCDGSIADIPRENYTAAEERVISELKEQDKPFALILNSAHPDDPDTVALGYSLEGKYGVPVALVNCMRMDSEDIRRIMELILFEFPVREIRVGYPEWVESLDPDHPVRRALNDTVRECGNKIKKISDIAPAFSDMSGNEYIESADINDIDLGSGSAGIGITLDGELFYRIMSEMTGIDISDEQALISTMISLAGTKRASDKLAAALAEANETGYGIVTPDLEDLKLEEPKIIRQSGGYGVKLRASAPSLHVIKANIETEINPIVGTEAQSEELVNYLMSEFEEDPEKIWESDIFGKSLHELMTEGLNTKLDHMPSEARAKLCDTLGKIINEGSSGLICILL
ncbi:MAG: stage IV sporulation protein A [Clostridia bacterium]|nr:stage IV sporulation protein A [Clostridia bacterium]